MKNVLIVVGTRPNFIKITQFKKEFEVYPEVNMKIVHTGQHFDKNMAEVFFTQFNLEPDYYLDIEQKSPLQQMAGIFVQLEQLINTTFKPDLIITPGDVNSTLAVSIVANKLNIPLAHLESGLRSEDRDMPEEINRILTDEISDYFFVTEQSGLDNLAIENKKGQAFFVGNTMIDTLVAFEDQITKSTVKQKLDINDSFILMTIHRPSNVDNYDGLKTLIELIRKLSETYQIVFPIHPRTINNINRFDLKTEFDSLKNIILSPPLGYFEFQHLVKDCALVLTDSGGIQEETTFRQKHCLTLRANTERPITITEGSNTLVPFDLNIILEQIELMENDKYKKGQIPQFWDGQATKRICEIIVNQIL